MKKLTTFALLTMLVAISGAIAISNTTDTYTKASAEQINSKDTPTGAQKERIEIKSSLPTHDNFKGIASNLRCYLSDIVTDFDNPTHKAINLSADKYDSETTLRLFYVNNLHYQGDIAITTSVDNTFTSEDKTLLMNQVDQTNFYQVDIDNDINYVKFLNADHESKIISLSNINEYRRLYDPKQDKFILNDNAFIKDDNNSRYIYSNKASLYKTNDSATGYLKSKVFNKKISLVFPNSGTNKNVIRLPWYIKEVTVDVIATLKNYKKDGNNYIIHLKKPVHIVRDSNKVTSKEVFLSVNGGAINDDDINKIVTVDGLIRDFNGGQYDSFTNHDKFMNRYFKLIKHDNADSICGSLKNLSQEQLNEYDALYNIITTGRNGDFALEKDYIDICRHALDKYDDEGNIYSIQDTLDFAHHYISMNQVSVMASILNNSNTPEIGITLVIFISSTVIITLFAIINKRKRKSL